MSWIMALLFLLAGAIIGILVEKLNSEKRIQKELMIYRSQLEQEKLEVRDAIENKLGNIRSSLISTIQAYTDTVTMLEEKIPHKNNPSTYLELKINQDDLVQSEKVKQSSIDDNSESLDNS